MSEYFTIERDSGLATLILNDLKSGVNTVSPAWIEQMAEVFEELKADESVTGVIITSGKPGFMAGADLKFILDHASTFTPGEAFDFSQRATAMHRLIETCGKPVVAAMNGFALGGGYELALACSLRLLIDDPRAVVGLPEVTLGLLPGSGGTQRLPRIVGMDTAMEVLLEGRSYPPEAALKKGLVDAVMPAGDLMQAARDWLSSAPDPVRPWDVKGFRTPDSDGLLKQTTAGLFTDKTAKLLAQYGRNYPAPISILTCLFEGIQVPFDAALRIESRHFARLLTNPVGRNIIRTTFVNKGLAEKGARRPGDVPARTVQKVAILGAGMMGAGIAYACAKCGIDVVLLDTDLEAAVRGKAYSEKVLARRGKIGKSTKEAADAILARIQPTTSYADLAGSQLIVEAVFEDTAVKADVTQKAVAVVGADTLFASNTSTLPITQLAEAFPRPENFIGLHFFSPVERMALVEVIRGERTGEETLAHALDFVAQIRKTPIVVNDSRGFYTSRVFQTFIQEGMELLREGVEPALIENGAKLAGMPVGPLALLDEVTLDLPMKIVRQSEAEDPAYRRPASMEVMEKMAEELGRSSRKAGGGFYYYPSEGPKRLWTGLKEHFPPDSTQPDVEDVKKRLLYVQAIETARCLEEGVLTHPADGDIGSVFGWGFPAWTGGTLSLIETVGVGRFVEECNSLAERYGSRFAPTEQLRQMAAKGEGFDY